MFPSARRCWGCAFPWITFRSAGILLLQWQGENFAYRQHLKFCHFQHVHCAIKNPTPPKVFNRISKSLPHLEDVDGGHLDGKFQVHRCFTFPIARWKLCASKTFEILPLSTYILCHQKPVSSKVFNRFSKSLPQLEDVQCGHMGGKVQVRRYFTFAIARWKLYASTKFEIFATFNLYTVPAKILYFRKVFNWLAKSLPELEDVQCGHLRGKCSGFAGILLVAIAMWKLCASTKFEGLPLSTCTLCQQKSYIYKGIHPIFEIFPSAPRRRWGRAYGWIVSDAQVFYFGIGNVKTLRIENNWNFPAFNLYSLPGKIPTYPKVFNRFWKSFPHLETRCWWECIWVDKFQMRRYFAFALARWKLCVSTKFEILPHSTCTLFKEKSYISKGHWSDFRKSFAWARSCFEGRAFASESFRCAGILLVATARWKLCALTKFEILPLLTCVLWQQKSYISTGIEPIFEIFASARRYWGWAFGWKV